MMEFLNMGGYGFYVWISYGVTFFIFVTFFISSGCKLKSAQSHIKRYIRRTGK